MWCFHGQVSFSISIRAHEDILISDEAKLVSKR
jgi:hypothetical protein